MNNIYHKVLCAILGTTMFCASLFSQDSKHELSVSLSGGKMSLNYDPDMGTNKGKLGESIGLGYTYHLTNQLGLVSGLEMSIYKSEFKADGFSNTLYNIADPSDGELFDFHSSVANYREDQTATYLNIPLQLQYEQATFGANRFYVLGGMKIGIPISAKYETDENSFVNKGFFHETGIWGGDNQEFMGFGSFNDKKSDGDLKLKTSLALSAEAGMKWMVESKIFLYTGFFIDYGLNNITSVEDNFISLKETSTGLDFSTNSALNSTYSQDKDNQQLISKATLLAIGIKVKLGFNL